MGGQNDLSAFVLAGGKSTRMGTDKAFVVYEGRPLLVRTIELLHSVTSDVCIVGRREKFASYGSVVEDIFPDRGPLGGIHAALNISRTKLNLMLAVDMPNVSKELLKFLIDRARATDTIVIVPRVDGRPQPLCAIYRKEFASVAEAALQGGQNKINPLFAAVRSTIIEEDDLMRAGFSSVLFRNINTPQELQELELPSFRETNERDAIHTQS